MNATNNIFWVASGSAFNIASQHQSGFSSDYNLFHLTGTGKVASWGTTPFSSWVDWQFDTGRDRHGLYANPLFIDPDGRTTRWARSTTISISWPAPALDAGNPLSF